MRSNELALNQNEYAKAPQNNAGLFIGYEKYFHCLSRKRTGKTVKTKKDSMLKQQPISIHQRSPLGAWFALPKPAAMQTISNDRFNGRMEKMYHLKRPSCAQT